MTDSVNIWTIIGVIFASTGFWSFMTRLYENRSGCKSNKDKAILGLLHDRIYDLGNEYILRGSVTTDEYDNFLYLYEPYSALGGNGTGRKIKAEVDKLPISDGGNQHDQLEGKT